MNELQNVAVETATQVATSAIPEGYEIVGSGMANWAKNAIAGTALAGAGVGAFFFGKHLGHKKAQEEFEEQMEAYEERLSAIEEALGGEYYEEATEEPTDAKKAEPEKVEGTVEEK